MTDLTTPVRIAHDQVDFDTAASVLELSSRLRAELPRKPYHRTVALARGENGAVHVGVAWCSPVDQFSRRQGRTKAVGRLSGHAKKHYYEVNSCDELERIIGRGIARGPDDDFNPLHFAFSLVQKDAAH